MPSLSVSVIICCYTDERLQDIREAVALYNPTVTRRYGLMIELCR